VSGAVRLDVQTVSGVVDNAGSDAKGTHVNNNNSIITVAGSEDLGGGMKAGVSLTYGLPMTNSGTLTGQNQFLSLSGGFGQVRLGAHDSLSLVAGRSVDLFGNQSAGDARAMTSSGTADSRGNDVIAYISPSFNGLTVALAHANQNTDGAANSGKINMAKVSYANGPLSLAAVSQTTDKTDDENIVRMLGSYTMGDTKLVALHQTVNNANGSSSADSKTWGVGAAHAMGPLTLKAQYYTYDLKNSTTGDANMTAVGVDYSLSKRTKLMAAYSVVTNKSEAALGGQSMAANPAAYVAGSDALTVAAGEDPKRFSIGVQHTF
ncbi:porin, partial [Candidatus Kaiserbacteria bacterium]|nr:porin [Candidatus Kaiserbacteria bacterium]